MSDHSHLLIWWVVFMLAVSGDDCGSTRRRVQELEERVQKLEARP